MRRIDAAEFVEGLDIEGVRSFSDLVEAYQDALHNLRRWGTTDARMAAATAAREALIDFLSSTESTQPLAGRTL